MSGSVFLWRHQHSMLACHILTMWLDFLFVSRIINTEHACCKPKASMSANPAMMMAFALYCMRACAYVQFRCHADGKPGPESDQGRCPCRFHVGLELGNTILKANVVMQMARLVRPLLLCRFGAWQMWGQTCESGITQMSRRALNRTKAGAPVASMSAWSLACQS